MKKQIISALIAGVLILGSGCGTTGNADELRENIAASSENYSISGTMMSYYFNDVYNTFVSYYGSYVEYLELDTEKSLRDQEADDGQSWYDYFMGGAKSVAKDILMLNELAAKDGMALSEAEKQAIKERAYRMDTGLYGDGITHDDIYEAKLLEGAAYKYQLAKKSEFMPDSAELEAARDAEINKYRFVDYYSFPIYYRNDGGIRGTFTGEEASAYADALAGSKSKGEFEEIVREILLAESSEMSEKDINDRIKKLAVTGADYTEGDAVSEWAFGEDSGKNLIIPDPDDMMYTVYMLTAEPYFDETPTVNVRHILLSEDTWGTKDAAKAKVQELYNLFCESDRSAEVFALLALEYTDDEGTCYNGGLYENLSEGMTVSEFNEWCFDPARKAGDVEVMEGGRGWHLMFYEGEGLCNWQMSVADDIGNDAMNEYLTDAAEGYEVTFFDDVINSIPG